jgi:hypothetical protein
MEELFLSATDLRQTKMYTAESLLPGPSAYAVETATEKMKRYKLPGSDKFLREMIKAGSHTLHSEIHKQGRTDTVVELIISPI